MTQENDQIGQDNVSTEEEDHAIRRAVGLFETSINFTLLRMGIPSSAKIAMIEEAIKKQTPQAPNNIEKDHHPNPG